MEHGVDLWALPLDRLFNLAYRLIVMPMDDEEREDFERSLVQAERLLTDSAGDIDPDAPAWWHGEEAAYDDMMAVMGSMGRRARSD